MKDKFVVTPDSFTQEQWCEMYVTVVNEYQNSKNNYNNILKKVDREIERLNNILGKYRTENVVNIDELLNKLNELKGDKE